MGQHSDDKYEAAIEAEAKGKRPIIHKSALVPIPKRNERIPQSYPTIHELPNPEDEIQKLPRNGGDFYRATWIY